MDSVPYKFCEDVIGSHVMTKSDWDDDAKALTGLWRIAAEKYAENLCILEITVWKDQGKWQCNIEKDWEMPEDMKLPKSIGELLAMDRRFIRIIDVVFGRDADRPINGTVITISSNDLVEKLIPFLNAQCLSYCSHYYNLHGSPEYRDEDRKIFQRYVNFYRLYITYNDQHSEDYMVVQTKSNVRLSSLQLNEAVHWPNSDEIEDFLFDLLRTTEMSIHIHTRPGSLMVTIRSVKDVYNRWCESGEALCIYANSNVTEEELLALTVPEGVTRYGERAKIGSVTMFIVRWRRGTTSVLECRLELSDQFRYAAITDVYIDLSSSLVTAEVEVLDI
ncbi:hypothetical protein QR680_010753 [Steinernema hermaphroditum]|uniref:Uncharacterized protein n=1 Tax=Steinernema hermaphroditum TaxID=289476 RepID=A0AA39IQ10_9BILA|nr:hypothetical protein QR680_010753 [Steinernema hermaphroditum]